MGGSHAATRVRRLKYHESFVDHTGTLRHYFRRKGKRTALRGPFGSVEFWADYDLCLKGAAADSAKAPQQRPPVREGSFQALVAVYYASSAYRGQSAGSRHNYKRILDGFCASHGHRLVAQFKREHVEIIIGNLADKPGAGITLLKRLRTLCRFAMALKWIDADPTFGVKPYRSTEVHTWTEAELATFEARWAPGTRQRLAYALLLYTGQRGSDTHMMSRADIAGDTIHVVQQKTDHAESDEKLVIPMHPALQRELALHRHRHLVLLITDQGKPFSVKGFGQFMSKAIGAAGLPAVCKAHGLRKASGRRLAEAGCTAKQIQAILGHKTLAESERYTKKADQVLLARQAIERLKEADARAVEAQIPGDIRRPNRYPALLRADQGQTPPSSAPEKGPLKR